MAHVVVIGAGLGGVPAAFDLRKHLAKTHRVTLIGARPYFEFTPSNPWIAVGWRTAAETRVTMQGPLENKGVDWLINTVTRIDGDHSKLTLDDGKELSYTTTSSSRPARGSRSRRCRVWARRASRSQCAARIIRPKHGKGIKSS